jgi:hypothetical protein
MLCAKILAAGQRFFYYPAVHVGLGLGVQGERNNPIGTTDLSGGIGYAIMHDLYCFGGVKLDRYHLDDGPYLFGKVEYESSLETENIFNFSIYTGTRYDVTLLKFKEGKRVERLGLLAEAKLYFTHWVPNRFNYWNTDSEFVKKKGPHNTQFAYGLSAGILLGSLYFGYGAFKFEINTLDPFATLRSMDIDLPAGNQWMLSLNLYVVLAGKMVN